VTAAPTAGDERFLRFPRRCCCAIRVKGDYAPPAAAAQASVLVAPDDSRGGGLGVVPVFAGAWLGHGCINGNLETDAGCDTRHSAFVDSALLPQASGPHSVSVVKGLGHASLTVHAGRLPMA
jgi:hypothetical protein